MYQNLHFSVLIIIAITGVMSELVIISRDGWKAKPPKSIQTMINPVPYVVIHHSESPGACSTKTECETAMRGMQSAHQNANGWVDIGYHFAVGGDGNAYEGRGWSRVGAHAPNYNNISIGICVIGNWKSQLPPANQLKAVHQLIEYGVSQRMIDENYKLVGHRQVRNTDCPGDVFYNEVKTWDHFVEKP